MRKVRSNALWRGLSAQQQETLDHWLFDEKLSYAVILPRAKSELGFKGSRTSLQRYYARRETERTFTKFENLGVRVAAMAGVPADAKALRNANMQVFNAYLFQALRDNPDALTKLTPVVRAMLQNEFNENFHELKDRDLRLREQAMAFAKEKFEFDTMGKALKALPQLRELEEAKKDPHTKRYEENAYWNQVRHAMYGLGIEVQPESAQEEAELAAARKAREERQKRAQEMQANIITNAAPPAPSSPHYEEYMKAQAKWDLENWGMCGEYEI